MYKNMSIFYRSKSESNSFFILLKNAWSIASFFSLSMLSIVVILYKIIVQDKIKNRNKIK